MAIVFPTDLDSLTNPNSTDKLNSPDHTTQHSNLNDAVEAIETKVGKNASAVTTSHDYKLSGVTGTAKAVSNAGNETVAGNKTFSGQTAFDLVTLSKGLRIPLVVDSYQATVTFNISEGNLRQVTLGGNPTLAVSNVAVGTCFALRLVQDGAGSRTVTWWATIKWEEGTAPTLSTVINAVDWIGFVCTSSGNYDGFVMAQNMS